MKIGALRIFGQSMSRVAWDVYNSIEPENRHGFCKDDKFVEINFKDISLNRIDELARFISNEGFDTEYAFKNQETGLCVEWRYPAEGNDAA